jgi:peptidoglycan/xylan/chitin deacetylase (PgdA/CDA1 family)
VAAPGSATGSPSRPLPIGSASLQQDGLELVWRVRLAVMFSPAALARAGRSLCLQLTRNQRPRAFEQLCVTGPARGSRRPRVTVQRITPTGPTTPRLIDARVSRPSAAALTVAFVPAAAGLPYRPLRWQAVSSARVAACTPPAAGSTGCSIVFPSHPRLSLIHVPVPSGCAPSGPSFVTSGPSDRHEVALTFDDGPWSQPPTVSFLNVLEREHAVATFFEIGRQIDTYDPGGREEQRMLADGDFIGNHTWSHPMMTRLSPFQQRAQLIDTDTAITHATRGFTTCLWRPPYGDVNSSLVSRARSLGLLTIGWDIDPRDWARPGEAAIYSNVVENAHNGAIVLQHSGGGPRYQTLAALPHEIETLRRRGYRFVTIPELLGLRVSYR